MSKSKLKPCPFCGGDAVIIKTNRYYVQCNVCEAIGTYNKGTSKTDKMAIEKVIAHWNNRKAD